MRRFVLDGPARFRWRPAFPGPAARSAAPAARPTPSRPHGQAETSLLTPNICRIRIPRRVADCYTLCLEASAKKAPKKTTPTRVDAEIFGEAQAAGAIHSRSAAQQIDLWVRIGKELESSPAISQRDIQRVLAGDGSYDEFSEREQAVVRAAWEEDIEERIARYAGGRLVLEGSWPAWSPLAP